MKRLQEIELRLREIAKELEDEKADVKALNEETNSLIEERKKIMEDIEARKTLLANISQNHSIGTVVKDFSVDANQNRTVEDEQIYKRAFLKKLLGEDLTDEETRAYTHTTANTGQVIPKELQDKIYSTMEEKHPLLKDVQVLRTGAVVSIVKHTTIVAGDAKSVNEGEANDDEQNTFVNVELTGKDFSKHVEFSYRLGKMAIPAFEAYLVKEIADRIGSAMTKDIVAQIKTDLHSNNKFTPTVNSKLTIEDLLKGLSLLKNTGKVIVYANNTSFYGAIASLEGSESRLSFIPNFQENISGQILGKPIKEEDALANGEILILDPSQFLYNVVQDIMIERDKDVKKHVNIISGFAIAGGSLTNDKAGAMITVTIGG